MKPINLCALQGAFIALALGSTIAANVFAVERNLAWIARHVRYFGQVTGHAVRAGQHRCATIVHRLKAILSTM